METVWRTSKWCSWQIRFTICKAVRVILSCCDLFNSFAHGAHQLMKHEFLLEVDNVDTAVFLVLYAPSWNPVWVATLWQRPCIWHVGKVYQHDNCVPSNYEYHHQLGHLHFSTINISLDISCTPEGIPPWRRIIELIVITTTQITTFWYRPWYKPALKTSHSLLRYSPNHTRTCSECRMCPHYNLYKVSPLK